MWKNLAIVIGVTLGLMGISVVGIGTAPAWAGPLFGILLIAAPVIGIFVASRISTGEPSVPGDMMRFGLGLAAVFGALALWWMLASCSSSPDGNDDTGGAADASPMNGTDGGVLGPDGGGGDAAVTTCIENETFCEGPRIRRCGSDGVAANATVLASCAGETVKTSCGECGGGLGCVSPEPLCDGAVTAPGGSAVVFSTNGCGVACGARAGIDTITLNATIGGETWTAWVRTSLVPSGGTVTLHGSGAGTLSVRRSNGILCDGGANSAAESSGQTPPATGYVRATYGALVLGAPFQMEMGGSLWCGFNDGWMMGSLNVTGVIAEVQ